MKVTEHVEHLLKQGRKPQELVELGFPKSVVTRVRRQLTKEKAALQTKGPKGTAQAESHLQALAESPEKMAVTEQKLKSVESDLQKADNPLEALPELAVLVAAAQEVGTHRREKCPYLEDGLCIQRTWTNQGEIPQGIGEPILVEEERPNWYIKPSYFYCAMCTAFLEEFLEDRLDEVESEVSGDPLSGAKSRITCNSCGSKGFIAAAIKCTKCGHETYWGWLPKK